MKKIPAYAKRKATPWQQFVGHLIRVGGWIWRNAGGIIFGAAAAFAFFTVAWAKGCIR